MTRILERVLVPGLEGRRGGNVVGRELGIEAFYKPLSIASSVAGGLLAGAVFTQVWKKVSDPDQEPPEPMI